MELIHPKLIEPFFLRQTSILTFVDMQRNRISSRHRTIKTKNLIRALVEVLLYVQFVFKHHQIVNSKIKIIAVRYQVKLMR